MFKNGVLKYTSCYFFVKATDLIRYKPTGKAKCYQCLEFLDLESIEGHKSVPAYVIVKYNTCKTIHKLSETWESYIPQYKDSDIIDPVFGLSFWYQDLVKDNIIWAYNLRHLAEIKNYASSILRERTTDRFKMTMVEKLPDFIKHAKNREEVLKAIRRMESD